MDFWVKHRKLLGAHLKNLTFLTFCDKNPRREECRKHAATLWGTLFYLREQTVTGFKDKLFLLVKKFLCLLRCSTWTKLLLFRWDQSLTTKTFIQIDFCLKNVAFMSPDMIPSLSESVKPHTIMLPTPCLTSLSPCLGCVTESCFLLRLLLRRSVSVHTFGLSSSSVEPQLWLVLTPELQSDLSCYWRGRTSEPPQVSNHWWSSAASCSVKVWLHQETGLQC